MPQQFRRAQINKIINIVFNGLWFQIDIFYTLMDDIFKLCVIISCLSRMFVNYSSYFTKLKDFKRINYPFINFVNIFYGFSDLLYYRNLVGE